VNWRPAALGGLFNGSAWNCAPIGLPLQVLVKLTFYDAVAFARDTFQFLPVNYANLSATNGQDPLGRQALHQLADAGALDAEQDGEEFVRDGEVVQVRAVDGGEHPPGASLLERVQSVACGRTERLDQQQVGVVRERIVKIAVVADFVFHHFGGDPVSIAADRHHGLARHRRRIQTR
jgi:hypothetical protein